jgi:hypothetical protein
LLLVATQAKTGGRACDGKPECGVEACVTLVSMWLGGFDDGVFGRWLRYPWSGVALRTVNIEFMCKENEDVWVENELKSQGNRWNEVHEVIRSD